MIWLFWILHQWPVRPYTYPKAFICHALYSVNISSNGIIVYIGGQKNMKMVSV